MELNTYLISRKIDRMAFSKQLNCDYNTLNLYIRGLRIPRLDTALKIEKLSTEKGIVRVSCEDLVEFYFKMEDIRNKKEKRKYERKFKVDREV